jgi:hypothetical protein
MLCIGGGNVHYESIKPLTASITRDKDTILCTATGGIPPYTYTWDESKSFSIEPMTLQSHTPISSTITLHESGIITCKVKDSTQHIVKTQHMVFQ